MRLMAMPHNILILRLVKLFYNASLTPSDALTANGIPFNHLLPCKRHLGAGNPLGLIG